VEAALALQLQLLAAPWPPELLQLPDTREQRAQGQPAGPAQGLAQQAQEQVLGQEQMQGQRLGRPQGQMLFRGLRAKTGMYEAVPLSVVPHTTTGRADYFGTLVNRAARLMAGSLGGQVLLERSQAEQLLQTWAQAQAQALSQAQSLAPSQVKGGSQLHQVAQQQSRLVPEAQLTEQQQQQQQQQQLPRAGAGGLSPLVHQAAVEYLYTVQRTPSVADRQPGSVRSSGATSRTHLSAHEVQVLDNGDFAMKGIPGVLSVASVQLTCLSARSLDAQLPKGKATMLRKGSGIIGKSVVALQCKGVGRPLQAPSTEP